MSNAVMAICLVVGGVLWRIGTTTGPAADVALGWTFVAGGFIFVIVASVLGKD
jgi:hypothetical protein